jgi:altronate hydrolase
VIKISSTSETYRALPDDIDFDAGVLLAANSLPHLAEELLAYCIRVASGEKTATERMGQRQFQVWTAGKLSL